MGDQPVEALRGAFGVGRGVGPCSIFRPRLFAELYNSLAFRTQLYAGNPLTLAFNIPLALSDPVKPHTPPQHPYPIKDHLSSPVKPDFADHKRDEVQPFGYDKDLHQLAAFGEQDFLDFLGVDEAFLNVDPPQPSGKKKKGSGKKVSGINGKKDNGKKASGKKASRKSSGAEANTEASGEGTTDASEFSFTNFVQATNTLTESMKEKREYLLLRSLSLDES